MTSIRCFLVLLFLSLNLSHAQKGARNLTQAGRSNYNASCAACHGLDGSGSDKAVNISGSARVRQLSDTELAGIIKNGVPGTGMPAFRTFTENQIRSVVAYVRSLQGRREARTLPGDAHSGQAIFFGKGECSSCHTVSGQGGFLGPDLSAYAASSSAEGIRDEIVRQRRAPQHGYQSAVLTTTNGERLEGLIRNEDNFSIQFQSKDGAFHFFQKADLRNIELHETSLMPSDYGQKLSSTEVNDLVSFLMKSAPDVSSTKIKRKREDDFE
jgi:cytochrome c oxidase cbb3-type subunit III